MITKPSVIKHRCPPWAPMGEGPSLHKAWASLSEAEGTEAVHARVGGERLTCPVPTQGTSGPRMLRKTGAWAAAHLIAQELGTWFWGRALGGAW